MRCVPLFSYGADYEPLRVLVNAFSPVIAQWAIIRVRSPGFERRLGPRRCLTTLNSRRTSPSPILISSVAGIEALAEPQSRDLSCRRIYVRMFSLDDIANEIRWDWKSNPVSGRRRDSEAGYRPISKSRRDSVVDSTDSAESLTASRQRKQHRFLFTKSLPKPNSPQILTNA